jgi:hypothetical protein
MTAVKIKKKWTYLGYVVEVEPKGLDDILNIWE